MSRFPQAGRRLSIVCGARRRRCLLALSLMLLPIGDATKRQTGQKPLRMGMAADY